jgi:hypothetical protein
MIAKDALRVAEEEERFEHTLLHFMHLDCRARRADVDTLAIGCAERKLARLDVRDCLPARPGRVARVCQTLVVRHAGAA